MTKNNFNAGFDAEKQFDFLMESSYAYNLSFFSFCSHHFFYPKKKLVFFGD